MRIWRKIFMSDQEKTVNERMIELQLFDTIMRWEHDNKYTKEFSDKQMQDRIKKLIQTKIQVDESE